MASVILKSLKLTRILNGRMSFTSSKLYYFHSRRMIKPYEHSRNQRACYAAAIPKPMSNDELVMKNDLASSNIQSNPTLDEALFTIDNIVKRNGRVLMKLVDNAFNMITSKEMTTDTHGLYLLRCCKYCFDVPPSKRIELVNKIWNKYQELGIQFGVKHYNTLLDVHIHNGLDFNPVEILDSMGESNIEPDRATYMLVMKKYCEDGNINGASEILEHMKEKGMPANEEVFNNLIQGHLKNKDFSGAKDMLEVMRSSNLQPTADTYGIFACGHAASGNRDEMMKYLKMVENDNSVQYHLKVIDALTSSGNHQYIDDVLSMIKQNEIYRQEFLNSAIELIHKDFVDIAYKLVLASFTAQYDNGFHIFVKQLVKTEKPISEIIKYCSKIWEGGFSDTIFQVAAKAAVEYKRVDCVIPIFKKFQELGHHLRPSSFWSLLSHTKNGNPQGTWLILKQMCELGVPADFTTYYDVIFPILDDLHPNSIINNVEKSGQSKETAADALFLYCCNLGKIEYVHHLIGMIRVYVSEKLNVEDFVNLYGNLHQDHVDKYMKVLKYMFMDENYTLDYDDIRGKLLAEMISNKPRLLELLLEHYKDLKFNQQTLRSCDHILSQKKPFKRGYQMVLRRLQDISVDREIMFKEDLTVEEENEEIKYLQAQNISCRAFLTRRINYHIKAKNLTRLSELLSIFDEQNFSYTPLLLSNLGNLYCMASDVEKAMVTFNKLKTDFPSFKLDLSKALDYVTLLVKYQKLDESIEALKTITEPYNYFHKENIVKKVSTLSLAVSGSNNPEFAKTMQNLLLPLSKEFKTKKPFLNSVLQLHLQRNDFNAAYEEFKNCIKNHHTPAGLSIFLKKCISMNETDILQKVIDLTISCESESYALLELCLAFIETRNYDKAIAVVESLRQVADPKDVEDLSMRLRSQNKLREMEHFINITRPLNHENRESLYCLAIKSYASRADFGKAVELYNELKKEVGEPSLKTVNFMQELLAKNNQPIPLALVSKSSTAGSSESIDATQTFVKYVEAGNVEAALKELTGLKKGYIRTLSLKTLTDLVDLCLQENCIHDLTSNVHAMSYIIDNVKDVLRPLVEKYAASGDVEKFLSISHSFPDFSLISLGFNAYFCKAFISSGKQEELLSELEERVDKKNKMFSFAAFEELVKYPEYENRIFNLAVKYYDLKFPTPMSALWALHFSKENFTLSDKILQNFTLNIDKADNIILRAIRQNENVTLAKKYTSAVKSLNVRNRVKERAYGAALDVLVLKEMYDEAVALVVESEELKLQLSKYYLSTLITLKNVLQKENKPVPFHVPSDVSSGSSSDSD